MKKLCALTVYLLILSFAGCIKERLSEDEFSILWQEYIIREFVESFDEEQSSKQRREIMDSVLNDFKVPQQIFYDYLRTKHKEKSKLFDVNP